MKKILSEITILLLLSVKLVFAGYYDVQQNSVVKDTTNITNDWYFRGNASYGASTYTVLAEDIPIKAKIYGDGKLDILNNTSNYLRLQMPTTYYGQLGYNGGADLTINNSGNVGIGINNAQEKLHIGSGGLKFPDGSVQTSAAGAGLWSTLGSDIYRDVGNVAIGTNTAPTEKLFVYGNILAQYGVISSTAVFSEILASTITSPTSYLYVDDNLYYKNPLINKKVQAISKRKIYVSSLQELFSVCTTIDGINFYLPDGILVVVDDLIAWGNLIGLSYNIYASSTGSSAVASEGNGVMAYVGTGAMFNGNVPTNEFFGVQGTLLVDISTSTPGQLFNITNTPPSGGDIGGSVFIDRIVASNLNEFGRIKYGNFRSLGIIVTNLNKGLWIEDISIAGTRNDVVFNLQVPGESVYKTTGTFIGVFTMNNHNYNIGDGVYAAYLNPGVYIVSVIRAGDVSMLQGFKNVFNPTGLDQTNPKVTAHNNYPIADSTVRAQGEFTSETPIVTDTPATSARVILNANNLWLWFGEERVIGNSTGTVTYTGIEEASLIVDGNIVLYPNLGTNQAIKIQFCKIFSCTPSTVTFTNATNTVNETGTLRQNGDLVSFKNSTGTLPAELRKDVIYYVINATANSFQLSYTLGGAVVTFTDDGTPPNFYNEAEFFGAIAQNTITNPFQYIPQAIVDLLTIQEIVLVVWNNTSGNDINSTYGYYRVRK